jgi:RNA polymerase sigma factor (sigma-70 family)
MPPENVNVPTVETQKDQGGWPETNSGPVRASSSRGGKPDEQLARAAGRGDVVAFEALYERHHRALLSFSRHMLGRAHDAEDVVQHTFLEADRAFRAGKVPKAVRAWLYTVARNRCVSLLRARRELAGLPDAGVPSTENLAAGVEQRDDLRALLGDLRALPDDQRAALLLAELGDLTHAEVAKVIGVRPGKVKALVFQAREALLAAAHARAIPCQSIREEIANATGAALRKRHLKHHLAQCEGCSAFAADVRVQRAALGALLPVVPTVALREGVFAGLATGGAAAGAGAGAGIGAGILANSTAAKLLTTLAVGGAAAGGGVAVTHDDPPRAQRSAPPPAAAPVKAPAPRTAPGAAAPEQRPQRGRDTASGERGRGGARERGRGTAPERSKPRGRDSAPGQAKLRDTPPGQAKRHDTPPGQAKPRGRDSAPGQAKPRDTPPGEAKPRATPPGQTKPRGSATAPGQSKPRATPPGQAKPKPAPKPAPAASTEPTDAAAPEAVDVPPGQARKG